ncbi:hypothetical protein PoB_002154700 [Plakobranchus ocellatus]|uniref:Uncharacterized protein n=1 Tax=Plakobranchus ocellatus TaxID=259542 RepID=A0AAV3ZI98_9GAST|nr:hypothetical protein PoB_002154700 [Plakobranchus ocellatus]
MCHSTFCQKDKYKHHSNPVETLSTTPLKLSQGLLSPIKLQSAARSAGKQAHSFPFVASAVTGCSTEFDPAFFHSQGNEK